MEYELYHYGIPGMKWGVRQARDASRDLDRKKSAYRRAKIARNRSVARGESSYEVIRKMDNYASAKNDYRNAKREFHENAPALAKIERGAGKATAALAAVGAMYIADKKLLGGVGTAAAKIAAESAVKVIGMATITAFTAARGDSNIKWKV